MDKAAVARFLATYRGVLITGMVKKSAAVSTGLLSSKTALKGDVITVFAAGTPNGCAGLINNPIQGDIEEKCCDGGGDAPCLLSQKYLIKKIKVATMVAQVKFKVSADYKAGSDFFRTGNFAKAIPPLKKAYGSNQLDTYGKWIFASSLEKTENCPAAIQPLTDIERAWVRGDTSGTDDKIVGPALLLLGRCLAKSSKAGPAVEALNLLLQRPELFKEEIRTATQHRDFSWISRSSEYKNFVDNAKRSSTP
jgi:hypothetical protein